MEAPIVKKSHISEVTEKIALCLSQIAQNSAAIGDAVSQLLAMEKMTRHDNDLESSKSLVRAILQILVDHRRWDELCEQTLQLCKRHAQLKLVVVEVVRVAMASLHLSPGDDAKLRLLRVLREVSKGKMHVEYEFAQTTKAYAEMQEQAGDVRSAFEVLTEVNAEALGSMPFAERFELMLEQLRLALAVGDKERAELAAEKFNLEWLDKKCEDPHPLKKRYYALMFAHHFAEKRFLEATAAKFDLARLERVRSGLESAEAIRFLKEAVLYSALAEETEEVLALRREILSVGLLVESDAGIKPFLLLLQKLTTAKFIVPAETIAVAKDCIENVPVTMPSPEPSSQKVTDEDSEAFLSAVKNSFVFHNLKTAEKHYTRLPLSRLAFLLALSEGEAESAVCEMVRAQKLSALIDRPAATVAFVDGGDRAGALERWAAAVADAAALAGRICGLIQKERAMSAL